MKRAISLSCILYCLASPAGAGMLDVPGDFPGRFRMELLAGVAVMDFAASAGAGYIHAMDLNTAAAGIEFEASAFDGSGPGAGMSQLSASALSMRIGTGEFFGLPITFLLDGGATGRIEDIDGDRGHWLLAATLYAAWNGQLIEYAGFSLSSDAGYTYDGPGGAMHVLGQAMDYASGDVYLVGQAENLEPGSGLYGTRITLGIRGNDPVAGPAVPLPGALWLLWSSLTLLLGWPARRAPGALPMTTAGNSGGPAATVSPLQHHVQPCCQANDQQGENRGESAQAQCLQRQGDVTARALDYGLHR